jgi:poly(3-hydroxybutyrate) depolymerase
MLAILLAAAVALPAAAAIEVKPGKSSFEFVDSRGRPDRPIRVYTYRPAACDASCPIQFVIAGVHRDASGYRDFWVAAADKYRFVVLSPEFSNWPHAAAYSLGDVAAQADPAKWSFSAIEHLFDAVRTTQADYRIFGHSAGGQFVHRMLLFLPDNRASIMVSANPGWYTMPEWRKQDAKDAFPFSLVGARVGERELKRALGRRYILMLGTADIDPDSPDLSKTAGAEREGATRFERGHAFFTAAEASAKTLGVPFAWKLVEVPGVAHEGSVMSRHAADLLYGQS